MHHYSGSANAAAAADGEHHQPLLIPPIPARKAYSSSSPSSVYYATKWVLKFLMWVVFVVWILVIYLYPASFTIDLFQKWINVTQGTVFGITGTIFLTFSAPLLIIALLAAVYLIISGNDDGDEVYREKIKEWKKLGKAGTFRRWRLWTFPVLVEGPFEVVSAAELIGIILFVVYVCWAVYNYTLRMLLSNSFQQYLPLKDRSAWMLETMGLRLGSIGVFCLAFLFVPISRGSVLLRLIDIPFEHATRYHVWLGHLTMLIFTLHGSAYVIGWLLQGRLLQQLFEWKDIGVANLPGVISLLAGLFMWITSLPKFRTKHFEIFFYTHQLYVVFVVFLALHVGDFIFSIASAGIFLFILDRFLRFCQSRKTVHVLSAKVLPCGSVELVLSKPKSVRYNALSFIFVQIRQLSLLEWHPFSVSSSPLDGDDRLSILIKVLGNWTEKLRGKILNDKNNEEASSKLSGLSSKSDQYSTMTVSVEGPYGHESPYHLTYENLILVAGGIGISPFLAILSDILHRIRDDKPCLPKKVLVVWAVKHSNELSLLSTLDVDSICPFFSDKLNIEISIYVTRETQPPPEGENNGADEYYSIKSKTTNNWQCPLPKLGIGSKRSISVLVGTGDNVWSGLYIMFSTVGFVLLVGLLDFYYINPYDINKWWYKGVLFLSCMVASVFLFGGLVVVLWNHCVSRKSAANIGEDDEDNNDNKNDEEKITGSEQKDYYYSSESQTNRLSTKSSIEYGCRPNFEEILGRVCNKWGNVEVGVMICGPSTLKTSVAKAIRSCNVGRGRQSHHPIFHFHSHSFDL